MTCKNDFWKEKHVILHICHEIDVVNFYFMDYLL